MESDSSGISVPDTGLPHGPPWPAHCGAVCSFPQRNSLVEINGEQCRGLRQRYLWFAACSPGPVGRLLKAGQTLEFCRPRGVTHGEG